MLAGVRALGTALLVAACGLADEAVAATVPFVGCKSDGQTGPLPAPRGGPVAVEATDAVAARLAYYQAQDGYGVLAPRGWSCFGLYGSDGAFLIVAQRPFDPANLFKNPGNVAGAAVQLSFSSGETSGRFEVARTIARVFPKHRNFAQQVIDEGIARASEFPFGPYPHDRLTNKGDTIVEFATPAEWEASARRAASCAMRR